MTAVPPRSGLSQVGLDLRIAEVLLPFVAVE
jgi:hypothetical protein